MVDHVSVQHAWRGQAMVVLTWREDERHRYLFQFGAYGTTFVLVYARCIEDGLEQAAEYLAEHAPGHIIAENSEEFRELYDEALAELVAEGADPEADETQWQAHENATADLTYTESGYLTSYEWYVVEDPSRAYMLDLLGRS